MSWLAEHERDEQRHDGGRLEVWSPDRSWPRPKIARISPTWLSSSQPRRRPSSRVSHGSGTRSIKGAQTNFKV